MLKRVAERMFKIQFEIGSVYGQRDELQRQLDLCREEKAKINNERNELAISLNNIRNKPLFKFYKALKSVITLKAFKK